MYHSRCAASGRSCRARIAVFTVLASFGFASAGHALTIKPTFDSSITSLAAAAQIETAFGQAAAIFQNAFTDPVTVNITVSWGTVHGQTIASGNLGQSWVPWYSGYSYSTIKSYLTRAALTTADKTAISNLPVTSPAGNSFAIPRAEMKALGLLSATSTVADGYIGFGYTPSAFTFNATSSVASGTYDFIGIAAHEIDEVLGRISTLNSTSPSGATVFDLFRYAAPGVPNFSRSAASYFSIDGGKTNLGSFNVSGGGDRSDWVYPTGTDAQQAYLPSGQRLSVASADLVALDILGWDSGGTNALVAASNSTGSISASAVPEPRSVILLGIGLLALGFIRLVARGRA